MGADSEEIRLTVQNQVVSYFGQLNHQVGPGELRWARPVYV